MLYDGPINTFKGAQDDNAVIEVGNSLDNDGELYLAMRYDGKMYKKLVTKFGKAPYDMKEESDHSSFLYLSLTSAEMLRDVLTVVISDYYDKLGIEHKIVERTGQDWTEDDAELETILSKTPNRNSGLKMTPVVTSIAQSEEPPY